MSGIFISYRRDDSSAYAGWLYDRLSNHFGRDQIFMDIDHIEPGEDFFEVIQKKLGSVQVAVVLIGKQWLNMTDTTGQRRLDNPDDFVRIEIATLLERKIRVIPVLVGGAIVPKSSQLPEPLAPLVRRNASEISDSRFHLDVDNLIEELEKIIGEQTPSVSPESAKTTGPEISVSSLHSKFSESSGTNNTISAQSEKNNSHRLKAIISTMVVLILASGLLLQSNPWTAKKTNTEPLEQPKIDQLPTKGSESKPLERIETDKISELLKVAEQGDAKAQNELGVMYYTGEAFSTTGSGQVLDNDPELAAVWLLRSAEQGYSDAQFNLGLMYTNGEGVEVDTSKAAELFKKAAEQGNIDAQYNLAVMYYTGKGVAKDVDKAIKWFEKATAEEQENTKVQANLGHKSLQ